MFNEPTIWMLPGGKRRWEEENKDAARSRRLFLELGLPSFEDQDWHNWIRFLWKVDLTEDILDGIECPSEDGSHYTFSGRLYWKVFDDGGVIFAIWRPKKDRVGIKVVELHIGPDGKEEYLEIHPTMGVYARHWDTLYRAVRAIGSDWQKPTNIEVATVKGGEENAEHIEKVLSKGGSPKYAATLY